MEYVEDAMRSLSSRVYVIFQRCRPKYRSEITSVIATESKDRLKHHRLVSPGLVLRIETVVSQLPEVDLGALGVR